MVNTPGEYSPSVSPPHIAQEHHTARLDRIRLTLHASPQSPLRRYVISLSVLSSPVQSCPVLPQHPLLSLLLF